MLRSLRQLYGKKLGASDGDIRHMAIPGISTNDGERFVVRANEKLTAFVELESAHSSRHLIKSKRIIASARGGNYIARLNVPGFL